MKVLCAFLVVVLAVHAAAQSVPAQVAPTFNIDLGAAPEDRYDELIPLYKDKFGPIVQFLNEIIPPNVQKYVDPIMAALDNLLPGDYSRELKGISSKSGIDLGQLVMLNLVYELTAYCTSIVAQHPNGTIFHSRNLDYDIPGLQNITVQLNFQQDGETLYSCTTFAGYVGCLTGVRPGGWSVTVNERDQAGSGPIDNLVALLEGGQSIGFFLRSSLQNISDFASALDSVSTTVLIAPVYITIGGVAPGEGAVVTRNRTVAADVWMIDSDTGAWWRLETNDDHWMPPEDKRRDVANAGMVSMGQTNLDNDGLYSVLSTPPVFNEGTVYSAQMVAATGYASAMIRWDRPTHVANPHPSMASAWIKAYEEKHGKPHPLMAYA